MSCLYLPSTVRMLNISIPGGCLVLKVGNVHGIMFVNLLWPSDSRWWHRSSPTWNKVSACCLTNTWTNVDLSSVRSSNIYLKTISQDIPQLPITGQPEYWIPFQSPRGQWVTSSPPWIRWQWPCNGVMQKYVIKWTLISKSLEYQYHTYEISHTRNINNIILAYLYDAA